MKGIHINEQIHTCVSHMVDGLAHTPQAIEGIHEDEWGRGAHCYDDGYKTVLDLCDIPNRDLQEHTAQFAREKEVSRS